ncbi:MAG: hypothetical protein QME32_06900 [Endomicrobiia bacterium]|nr:hypothetical protein [Endomicrobiia bacterium]
MSGGGFSVEVSQAGGAAGARHLRDSVVRGYGAMHSAGAPCAVEKTQAGYELSDGFEQYGFEPEYFRSIAVKRSGDSAFGFNEDAFWDWEVPALGGAPVTVDIYIRLAPEYGDTAQKPSVILTGHGVNSSASATAAAFSGWEKLTLSGTPSSNSVMTLSVSGYSRSEGARFFADDIKVSQ